MMMARFGRRPGFVLGALLGVAGGIISAAGIWLGSLLLLSLGTFLVGTYQSFAQFYRFAAGEVADDAFRPRAISLVLAGGNGGSMLPDASSYGAQKAFAHGKTAHQAMTARTRPLSFSRLCMLRFA